MSFPFRRLSHENPIMRAGEFKPGEPRRVSGGGREGERTEYEHGASPIRVLREQRVHSGVARAHQAAVERCERVQGGLGRIRSLA